MLGGWKISPQWAINIWQAQIRTRKIMKKKLQLMYSYKDFIAKDKYKYDTFHSLQDKHKSVHIFLAHVHNTRLGPLHWRRNHTTKTFTHFIVASHSLQMLPHSPGTNTAPKVHATSISWVSYMPWLACAGSETSPRKIVIIVQNRSHLWANGVPLGYTHHNEVKSVMVDLMHSPLDTAAG